MRVELNRKGMIELRNSDKVVEMLEAKAERIAASAGDGMLKMPAEKGRFRARVAVITATYEAMLSEMRDRALTRAIDAGRS